MSRLNTQQAFDWAVQYYQAGRLHEAEQKLRQILTAEPRHVEALHLLGAMAYQDGRYAEAAQWVERVIRLQPTNPFFIATSAYCIGGRIA